MINECYFYLLFQKFKLFETTKVPKKSTWILLGSKVSKSPREFLISCVAHILMTFPVF